MQRNTPTDFDGLRMLISIFGGKKVEWITDEEIDQLLADSPEKLIMKLEQHNPRIYFAPEQLIYIIENSIKANILRYTAYLELITHGDLADLQRLAPLIDTGYIDEYGNDVMSTAAAAGRLDVIEWLATSNHPYPVKEMTFGMRATAILQTVNNNKPKCLQFMCKPVEDGGLGWDPNIEYRGLSPVSLAFKDENIDTLKILLAPLEEGGFNLPIDHLTISRLYQLAREELNEQADIYYLSPSDTGINLHRSASLVNIFDADSQQTTSYNPERKLGKGGFGVATLFQAQPNTRQPQLAVKRPKLGSPEASDRKLESLLGARMAITELAFFQRAYPNESPYSVSFFINRDGLVDYRIVMPYAHGKMLYEVLPTHAKSITGTAILILSVMTELARLHNLDITHCDAKMDNYLIEHLGDDADNLPIFATHFVDFGFAREPGTFLMQTRNPIFTTPPEFVVENEDEIDHVSVDSSTDIYAFAITLQKHFHIIKTKLNQETFIHTLEKSFPSIMKFIDEGTQADPCKRPKLSKVFEDTKSLRVNDTIKLKQFIDNHGKA